MGQRLNLEITKDGNCLANSYYHWSGFTTSSLELTKTIIDNFDIKNDNDLGLAIELLMTTGATLNSRDLEYCINNNIIKVNTFKGQDRNEGLIGITSNGIEETRKWEEGRVSIDIVNKTIDFNCKYDCDETDIYTTIDLDGITKIPFDKVDLLLQGIIACEDNNGVFRIGDNYYYSIY